MRYSFKRKDRGLPLFVDSIGFDWEQESVDRPAGYPYVHWLQTSAGTGVITIQDQEIYLTPGQGILINRYIPHDYHAVTDNWTTSYFTFGGALVSEIDTLIGFHDFLTINEGQKEFRDFVQNTFPKQNSLDEFLILDASVSVYNFLIMVKKNMIKNQLQTTNYPDLILPMLNYMNDHYAENISNEKLAELIGYSPQYATKLFKKAFDVSPYQYLIELRIRKAKELLANNLDLSIQEVSELVGFNTLSYFTLTFKKNENVSPNKFRNYYKN